MIGTRALSRTRSAAWLAVAMFGGAVGGALATRLSAPSATAGESTGALPPIFKKGSTLVAGSILGRGAFTVDGVEGSWVRGTIGDPKDFVWVAPEQGIVWVEMAAPLLREVALEQMRSIGSAVDFYLLESRSLPKSLDELMQIDVKSDKPYLKRVPNDPWDQPYEYRVVNAKTREYRISSAGPDKQMGTDDDLVFPEPSESK